MPVPPTPCPSCGRVYALADPSRIYVCVCGGFLAAAESIAKLSAAAAEEGRTCSVCASWVPPGSWSCGACGASARAVASANEPDASRAGRIANARRRVRAASDLGRALYLTAGLGAFLLGLRWSHGNDFGVASPFLFAFAGWNVLAAWGLKRRPVGWAVTMAVLKSIDALIVWVFVAAWNGPGGLIVVAIFAFLWAIALWYVAAAFLMARDELGFDSRFWFAEPPRTSTPAT